MTWVRVLGVRDCPPYSAALVFYEASGDLITNYRFFLDLVFSPNPEFHNVLKLLRQIMPPVVVAESMCG